MESSWAWWQKWVTHFCCFKSMSKFIKCISCRGMADVSLGNLWQDVFNGWHIWRLWRLGQQSITLCKEKVSRGRAVCGLELYCCKMVLAGLGDRAQPPGVRCLKWTYLRTNYRRSKQEMYVACTQWLSKPYTLCGVSMPIWRPCTWCDDLSTHWV